MPYPSAEPVPLRTAPKTVVIDPMEDTGSLEEGLDCFVDEEEFSHCFTGECRISMLPVLYRISQTLAGTADLVRALPVVLEVMRQRPLKMQSGVVTLYDCQSGTIFIHDSFGLSEEEKKAGTYTQGEGISGKVIETGKALIAWRCRTGTGAEDEAGTRKKSSQKPRSALFCVPIMRGRKVLGTLAAERVYMNQKLLKQDVALLAMIASMLAPAAELYLHEHIEQVRLESENRRLRNALKERFRPANIIGSSKSMQEVYQLIHKVASTRATVLVLGESGVGKELVANAIHYNSLNADGPFITSNCAALPESLAESELFGHEKGSFTGAMMTHKGCFEQADGGTIFLDEIGELSMTIQAKLLRVLQGHPFERVGGSKPVKVDVRIIAATNRDLAEMVLAGTFREDLYYRLNVFPIVVPPLRERGSDIITLADHFVMHFARENGKDIRRISTPALNMLMSYHWPGNVRELENVMERAVILSDDEVIHSYNLPPSLQTSRESGTAYTLTLEEKVRAVEYEMIVDALKSSSGHMGKAAEELGLTRRMLAVRMEKYGISYKTFRASGGEALMVDD